MLEFRSSDSPTRSGVEGRKMACKACASESLIQLEGEVTASFPHAEDLKAAPIYFSQSLWVCLDCGFAEVRVPPAQLEDLRKKKAFRS